MENADRYAMTLIQATYTSEWQDGTVVTTDCKWDAVAKVAVDIEVVDVEIDASLDREYVSLPDGSEIDVEEGKAVDDA